MGWDGVGGPFFLRTSAAKSHIISASKIWRWPWLAWRWLTALTTLTRLAKPPDAWARRAHTLYYIFLISSPGPKTHEAQSYKKV